MDRARVQGALSALRQHFLDFYLNVSMSAQFSLGQLQTRMSNGVNSRVIPDSGGNFENLIDKLFITISSFPCGTTLTINMWPNKIEKFPSLPEITPELPLLVMHGCKSGRIGISCMVETPNEC